MTGQPAGRVLDVPAVIDLGTGRTRYMAATAYRANQRGDTLAVPAAAYAAALADVDDIDGRRIRDALAHAVVTVLPLEGPAAGDVGALARDLRLSIPAAHVAHSAWVRGWPIITRAEDAPAWRALGFTVEPIP